MSDFDTASLGDALRAERQRQGKDLATMAVETKICSAVLQALERNQFDGIPGGSYRQHFLRQYARALGLDEGDALAAFHQQYEEPELPLPTPPKRTRSWRVLELGWVLTTAAAVLGVYRIAESLHTTAPWKETGIMAHAPSAAPAKRATPAPAPVSDSGNSADRGSTDNSSTGKSSTAPVRVAFTATEPVWVSVKCDGSPSYTGTLLGPETKTFEASNAVTVLIGNAGGLTIFLNGKPVGPVGGHGETRSLELTPSGVRGLPRPSTAKTIEFEPRPENLN